ncbi:MAG TPA: hypothetical protein VG497_27620 [Kribbella sp.]|nr:hypothetical protein [Kribbella sp.]
MSTRSLSLGPGFVVGVLVVVDRPAVGRGGRVVTLVGCAVGTFAVEGASVGSVGCVGAVGSVGLYEDVVVGSAYDESCPFNADDTALRAVTPTTRTNSSTSTAISGPRPFFLGGRPPGGAPQPNCGCP